MKSRFVLGFLVMILWVVAVQAQKVKKKYFINEWKFVSVDYDFEVEMNELARQQMMEVVQDARFVFRKDKSYEAIMMGQVQKGWWKWDKKNKLLITTSSDGESSSTPLREMSPQRMVIVEERNGERTIMTLEPVKP